MNSLTWVDLVHRNWGRLSYVSVELHKLSQKRPWTKIFNFVLGSLLLTSYHNKLTMRDLYTHLFTFYFTIWVSKTFSQISGDVFPIKKYLWCLEFRLILIHVIRNDQHKPWCLIFGNVGSLYLSSQSYFHSKLPQTNKYECTTFYS